MDINTIWVELLPVYYYKGSTHVADTKVGRILKRQPTQEERRNFVRVKITNERSMFAPTATAEVTA